MLVYLPATLRRISQFIDSGTFSPANKIGFGITPHLQEVYTYDDEEELAEVAFDAAAEASLRLLAAEIVGENLDESAEIPQDPYLVRRVVIQAEVTQYSFRSDLDESVIEIRQEISLADVVAVYVDLADAEKSVWSATLTIDAADLGQEDAIFLLEDARDHRMAWYSAQEIPFLLELIN